MTDHEKDEERRRIMAAVPDVIKRHLSADYVPMTPDEARAWQKEEARKYSQEINQRMRASLEKNMSMKTRTEPLGPAINPATAATAATFRTDPEDRAAPQNEDVKDEDIREEMMIFPEEWER